MFIYNDNSCKILDIVDNKPNLHYALAGPLTTLPPPRIPTAWGAVGCGCWPGRIGLARIKQGQNIATLFSIQ